MAFLKVQSQKRLWHRLPLGGGMQWVWRHQCVDWHHSTGVQQWHSRIWEQWPSMRCICSEQSRVSAELQMWDLLRTWICRATSLACWDGWASDQGSSEDHYCYSRLILRHESCSYYTWWRIADLLLTRGTLALAARRNGWKHQSLKCLGGSWGPLAGGEVVEHHIALQARQWLHVSQVESKGQASSK